jgi:integrase
MPRTFRIPAYGLHRPTGQARVRINGRDIYLGRHGSEESKVEYEKLVRKLITDRAKDEVKARVEIATDLTINELAAAYLKHARTYYVKDGQPTKEFANVYAAVEGVRGRHGFELVTAFGPLKLKAIRDQWIEAGLVRAQINARVGRVRRWFSWAIEEELAPPSVLQALENIKGLRKGRTEAKEGKKILPVADNLVDAIQPFVSRQVWAMVELQKLSGMRPEEVCIMRTIDIDTTGDTWIYRPSRHKTEHHEQDRIVFLGPKAVEVLKPWLRPNVSEYLFSPKEATAERHATMRAARRTRVQPSHRNRKSKRPRIQPGDRYARLSYQRSIANACDRAFPHPTLSAIAMKDLTDEQRTALKTWRNAHRWRPNQLRHSAATRLRREFGLDVAKAVLGHSTIATTQIYAEQDMEAARQAMQRLG